MLNLPVNSPMSNEWLLYECALESNLDVPVPSNNNMPLKHCSSIERTGHFYLQQMFYLQLVEINVRSFRLGLSTIFAVPSTTLRPDCLRSRQVIESNLTRLGNPPVSSPCGDHRCRHGGTKDQAKVAIFSGFDIEH